MNEPTRVSGSREVDSIATEAMDADVVRTLNRTLEGLYSLDAVYAHMELMGEMIEGMTRGDS